MSPDRLSFSMLFKLCCLSFIGIYLSTFNVKHVIAQMKTQSLDNGISNWQLVTDGVMGGVSKGTIGVTDLDNKTCIELSGSVSTDNNGGFIQMAYNIDASLAQSVKHLQGIQLEIRGNGEDYNLHLRTKDLWFPWQAFRATFQTNGDWQIINLPFSSFQAYKTSEDLNVENLKRIGVVAIGREFDANICVASIGFY
ncbi:MAG: hypothetical protein HKP55_06205 [Gammaproteobacteria bacterium]|nr:hypothetical protein [Gammaproteobacteria bacterium]